MPKLIFEVATDVARSLVNPQLASYSSTTSTLTENDATMVMNVVEQEYGLPDDIKVSYYGSHTDSGLTGKCFFTGESSQGTCLVGFETLRDVSATVESWAGPSLTD